jgi:hypothetical protein
MMASGWLPWLAVAFTVVLSSVTIAGPGKLWIPFVRSPEHHVELGIAKGTAAQVKALGGSWYHNFGSAPEGAPGVEAVPMIFGRDVPSRLGGNSEYLLGMSEPDKLWGANMTPEEGAQVWRKIELAFPYKLLISPAPSHEDPEWLVRFRDAYRAAYGKWPRLDGLAMHCYIPDQGGCIALGQKYVGWAREWGVPEIWVTEFAYLPKWALDAEAQAREFVAWMNGERLIKRYAPWTAYIQGGAPYWPYTDPETNPSLFTGPTSTELTSMGRWYKK